MSPERRDVRFLGFQYRRVGRLSILTFLRIVLYRRIGSLRCFRWMIDRRVA